MTNETIAFMCEDGKLFHTLEEAVAHEMRVEIRAEIKEFEGATGGHGYRGPAASIANTAIEMFVAWLVSKNRITLNKVKVEG